MRKILFLTCVLMLMCMNQAFCLNFQSQVSLLKHEINKFDESKDKKEANLMRPIIKANLDSLVGAIHLKIKKYESKLEKIKEQIRSVNEDGNDPDKSSGEKSSEKYLKKFDSIQKKISSLNDLLSDVEQLKLKLID